MKTLYTQPSHAYPNPSFQLCGSAVYKGYPVVRDTTTKNYVKLAGANAKILGISMEDVTVAGDPVAVKMYPCFAVVKLSGTVADGDPLKTANDGTFLLSDTVATDNVVVYAQEGGSTGEYIEVLLVQPNII